MVIITLPDRAREKLSQCTRKMQPTQIWTTQGTGVRVCVCTMTRRPNVSISHEVCIRGTVVYPKLTRKFLHINHRQSKYPARHHDTIYNDQHDTLSRARTQHEHWLTLLFSDEVKWYRITKPADTRNKKTMEK